MRQISEPHEHRADEAANHLCEQIPGHLGPLKTANQGQADGDRGVRCAPADPADGVDRDGHGDTPSDSNHDPAAVLPLGPIEDDVCDDAVAQEVRAALSRLLPLSVFA